VLSYYLYAYNNNNNNKPISNAPDASVTGPEARNSFNSFNSTQLNFIDERVKTTTDIVIKINTN